MACITLTKFHVDNFESWKAKYDQGDALRREFGVRSSAVLRDGTDPNLVTVMTRFDSIDAAKKMTSSDRWKQAAKSTGVSKFEMSYTNVADEKSY